LYAVVGRRRMSSSVTHGGGRPPPGPVRRPTLHCRTVRLRPVRAKPCLLRSASLYYLILYRKHRLLLQMSHLAWSVCLCVVMYVLDTQVSCAKTTRPIKMPFTGLMWAQGRNHVLNGVKILHGKG